MTFTLSTNIVALPQFVHEACKRIRSIVPLLPVGIGILVPTFTPLTQMSYKLEAELATKPIRYHCFALYGTRSVYADPDHHAMYPLSLRLT